MAKLLTPEAVKINSKEGFEKMVTTYYTLCGVWSIAYMQVEVMHKHYYGDTRYRSYDSFRNTINKKKK
jgi:hypothetical protein